MSRHLEDAYATAAGVAVGVGVAASVLTAAVVSLLVTRRIFRPVRALNTAAARLAGGDFATRMPPAGLGPEFDTLTGAFNTMAATLEGTEQARLRLLADVTHEMRTPLATIGAYLECLADGVRSPGQQSWDILAGQTMRLRRLVDDITLVSRAEEHQLELEAANHSGTMVAACRGWRASSRRCRRARPPDRTALGQHGLLVRSLSPDRRGVFADEAADQAVRHGEVRAHVATGTLGVHTCARPGSRKRAGEHQRQDRQGAAVITSPR